MLSVVTGVQVALLLVEGGCGLDWVGGRLGGTALHWAGLAGAAQVAGLLLRAGARTDIPDRDGCLPGTPHRQ